MMKPWVVVGMVFSVLVMPLGTAQVRADAPTSETKASAPEQLLQAQQRLARLEKLLKGDLKSLSDDEFAELEKIVNDRFFPIYEERRRRDGPEKPLTAEELYRKCSAAVTSVVTTRADGGGTGTGFFYEPGCVLTNFHVAARATKIRVQLPDGKFANVESIEWADRESDLALLRLEGTFTDKDGRATHPLVQTGFSDELEPAVGAQIYVIGDPRGLQKTLSQGIVSGIREGDDFQKLIQISVPVSPGSSGSPVFNQFGRVVGVVTQSLRDGQNLNFCVPVDYARAGTVRLGMTLERWGEYSRPRLPQAGFPPLDPKLLAKYQEDEDLLPALSLRSFDRAAIIVEDLSEGLKGVVTQAELEDTTRRSITRSLPWVKLRAKGSPDSEESYLYVNILGLKLTDDLLVVSWSIQLKRASYLKQPTPVGMAPKGDEAGALDGLLEWGVVWDSAGLLTGDPDTMAQRIRGKITEAIGELGKLAESVKVP